MNSKSHSNSKSQGYKRKRAQMSDYAHNNLKKEFMLFNRFYISPLFDISNRKSSQGYKSKRAQMIKNDLYKGIRLEIRNTLKRYKNFI